MNKLIISYIIILASWIATNHPIYGQAKTIEERLTELEQRVQALEAKLGTTQTTSKLQQPKTTVDKPSDEAIYTAIREKLKKEVPPSWAGSLLGGTNGVIEKIEIQQMGNFNEQGRYWAVKCRVKGVCDAELLVETKKVAFDKIGDFKIKLDDYGKWYAEIETF